MYILTQLREELIKEIYKERAYRHLGVEKILKQIIRNYYFLIVRQKVVEVITKYVDYSKNKIIRHTLLQILVATKDTRKSIRISINRFFIIKLLKSKDIIIK